MPFSTSLNLLPPAHKKEIDFHRTFQYALHLFWAFAFVLLALNTLLVNTVLFLKVYNHGASQVLESSDSKEKAAQIQEIQKQIDREKKEFAALQPLAVSSNNARVDFEYLLRLMPSLLVVHAIDLDGVTQKASVQGFVSTRAEAIELEKILRNASRLKNVEYPYTNVIPAKDINVSFSFEFESAE